MINSQLLKRHTLIVRTNSKTSWILHANVCRSAKTELSRREGIRGDCNFTHGVTHWSVTLRLSAYALQCEKPSAVVLFHPSSSLQHPRRVFCCRPLNVRMQLHAMEYLLLFLSLSFPFIFLLYLLSFTYLCIVVMSHYLLYFVTNGTDNVIVIINRWPGAD